MTFLKNHTRIHVWFFFGCLLGMTNGANAIVIRHEVPDSLYKNLGKQVQAVCNLNLPDGAGTVINSQWVLTAAHCGEVVAGWMKEEFHTVIIDDISYGIDDIILHPQWRKEPSVDLALIKLSKPVPHAAISHLYDKQDEAGQIVTFAGWGSTGNGNTGIVSSDYQFRAATNKIETAENQWITFRFDPPDSGATSLEGISGPGDSGGPAFVTRNDSLFIVGVSSWQNNSMTGGVQGKYGVIEYYARVSPYVEWIRETIRKNTN